MALDFGLISRAAPSSEVHGFVDDHHHAQGTLPARNERVVDVAGPFTDERVEVFDRLFAEGFTNVPPGPE